MGLIFDSPFRRFSEKLSFSDYISKKTSRFIRYSVFFRKNSFNDLIVTDSSFKIKPRKVFRAGAWVSADGTKAAPISAVAFMKEQNGAGAPFCSSVFRY